MSLERPIPARRVRFFGALGFRDFRLLWGGLLVSNLGTWMQFTATGYFVAKLAGSPEASSLYVGILGAMRAIPVLLLSPIAGVVADNYPRKRTLFVTNTAIAALALLLAVLTTTNHISIWGLIGISALNAAAQSFDAPARQSWVPLMVDREYVGNAIGLNSIAFNAPAVVGPAAAGLLIQSVGVSASFYINAGATMAVVVALLFMRPSPASNRTREPFVQSLVQGIRFVSTHGILKYIMLFFVVSALLARPYSSLLPAYAIHYLHTDARGMSLAMSAVGVGGFLGAVVTAIFGSREGRGVLWLGSALVMSIGVVALGVIHSLGLAYGVLAVTGLATLALLGASNILVQTLSGDEVRGRAMAVYTMIALGLVPLGSFLVGGLGSLIGLHLAFEIAGGLCAVLALYLAIFKRVLTTV